MSNMPMHPYDMQQLQMQMQMQAQAQAMHAAHMQQQQQQQQQMQYYPQQQVSPEDHKLDTSSQLAMLEAQHAALQAQYTAEAQMQQAIQQQQAQMRQQQHMQAAQAAASGSSPIEHGYAIAAVPGSEGAAKPRRAPRPAPSSGTARAGSEVTAGQGPGTSLGEILVLAKRFEKVSNDDPRTKLLYTVCFPYFSGQIPDRTAKKSLRLFNGWGTAEMRAAARIRLAEHAGDADLLRKLARLLDLSHEGTADELCARLEDWLASPSAVVHAPKEEGGAGDGKKKRKASEKKEKQKRPPNPYLLFANEKREEVVRSKPDLLMMEVNRILGQLWASVSDADRAPYIESAARLREVWDREHPEQAAKNAASAAAGGSGSGRKRRPNNGAAVDPALNDGAESDLSDSAAAAAGLHPRSRVASSPSPVSSALSNQLALQLQSSVLSLLRSTPLERLSLRLVKQQLAQQFSESIVQHNAQIISDLVDQELLAMS